MALSNATIGTGDAAKLEALCFDILSSIPQTALEADELCVKIRKLEAELKSNVPTSVVQSILPLAARPLTTILQYFTVPFLKLSVSPSKLPPRAENVRESLLAASAVLLEKCHWIDDSIFVMFLSTFLRVFDLDSSQAPGTSTAQSIVNQDVSSTKPSLLSEELHENLSKSLKWLFTHYDPRSPSSTQLSREDRISQRMKDSDLSASLGYAIYRVLEIGSTTRSKHVALSYLQAMHAICQALSTSPFLPSILPGMLVSFSRILGGDFKQGSAIFESTTQLLAFVIVTTMNDAKNPSTPQRPSQQSKLSSSDAISMLKSLKTKMGTENHMDRNAPNTAASADGYPSVSWFSNAISRVETLLQRIFRLANRGSSLDEFDSAPIAASSIAFENPRVKCAIARAAHQICMNCSFTFQNLVPLLLDVLVTLLFDDFPDVSDAARVAIDDISGVADSSNSSISEILERNFDRLLASLPRVIRMTDESAKIMRLRALLGYLMMLRKFLPTILPSIMPRLSDVLVDILEINLKDPWIMRPRSSMMIESSSLSQSSAAQPLGSSSSFTSMHLRRQFLHFQDAVVLRLILTILRFLGAFGDPIALTDHFSGLLRAGALDASDPSFPPQVLLILNELLQGIAHGPSSSEDPAMSQLLSEHTAHSQTTIEDVTDSLLAQYLSPDLWNLSEQRSSSAQALATNRVAAVHAVSASFLLEGVGVCAQIMGSYVKYRLMAILYPVLEKLGDEVEMVSLSAWSTLLRVAFYGEYESVLDLIRSNSDYVVDSVVQNLRYLKKYGASIRVLHGVLRHAGELVVPVLKDIINEIFRCLDERDPQYSPGFLRVMSTAAELILRRVSDAYKEAQSATKPKKEEKITPSYDEVDLESARLIYDKQCPDLRSFLLAKIEDRRKKLIKAAELRKETSKMSPEQFFRQYHEEKEKKKATEMHPDDPVPDDDEPSSIPSADDDPFAQKPGEDPIKHSIRVNFMNDLAVVSSILEKCQHYTAIKGVDNRILVINIITTCVQALECDQNTLLPLVHKVWEPLTHRFIDQDHRVAAKALELMQVLGSLCGDFMSKRFADDLWPKIKPQIAQYNIFAERGKLFASRNDEATQYSASFVASPDLFKFTPSFRSQRAMLECLVVAADHISLTASISWQIVTTVWFYLSDAQPPEFSKLARHLFQSIAKKNGDMVWRLLADFGRIVAVSPSSKLMDLKADLDTPLRVELMAQEEVSLNAASQSTRGLQDNLQLSQISRMQVFAEIGPKARELLGIPTGLFSIS